MKKYWFYGIMPKDAIDVSDLTEEHKKIIESENNKLTKDNLLFGWLGYFRNNKWEFMRHGFELIIIDEHRGNIARKKLEIVLKEKYL